VETFLHITLVLAGAAFSGGGFYVYVRISLAHVEKKIDLNHSMLKADLAGVGYKVARNENSAARRYHNLSLAIMHSCPTDKENEVSHLMKEEAN
jgi:hypothetical protein